MTDSPGVDGSRAGLCEAWPRAETWWCQGALAGLPEEPAGGAEGKDPGGGVSGGCGQSTWSNVSRASGECRGGQSRISQAGSPGCILSVGMPHKCWKHLEEC